MYHIDDGDRKEDGRSIGDSIGRRPFSGTMAPKTGEITRNVETLSAPTTIIEGTDRTGGN